MLCYYHYTDPASHLVILAVHGCTTQTVSRNSAEMLRVRARRTNEAIDAGTHARTPRWCRALTSLM